MAGLRSRNISVSERAGRFARHARLKFDETRQRWVILAPERVLAPDEIAVEVLQLCDGVRSVEQMIDQLAAKYAANATRSRPTSLPCCRTLPTRDSSPSAREGFMTPTLTNANIAASDPSDGLAYWSSVARRRRFRYPLACSPN